MTIRVEKLNQSECENESECGETKFPIARLF